MRREIGLTLCPITSNWCRAVDYLKVLGYKFELLRHLRTAFCVKVFFICSYPPPDTPPEAESHSVLVMDFNHKPYTSHVACRLMGNLSFLVSLGKCRAPASMSLESLFFIFFFYFMFMFRNRYVDTVSSMLSQQR